jgi:hypothetical protein
MADLLLRDLVVTTGGRLTLASMPPRDGDLLMLRRSRTSAADVRPGDVFWALRHPAGDGMFEVEEAFSRGAAGAAISGRTIEPWPGKFVVAVDDVRSALWQAASHARARFEGVVIAVTGDNRLSTARCIHRGLGTRLSGSCTVSSDHGNEDAALALLNAHPSHGYAVIGVDRLEAAKGCSPHVCVAGEGAQRTIHVAEPAPMSALLAAEAIAKILQISDLSISTALGNLPARDVNPYAAVPVFAIDAAVSHVGH